MVERQQLPVVDILALTGPACFGLLALGMLALDCRLVTKVGVA